MVPTSEPSVNPAGTGTVICCVAFGSENDKLVGSPACCADKAVVGDAEIGVATATVAAPTLAVAAKSSAVEVTSVTPTPMANRDLEESEGVAGDEDRKERRKASIRLSSRGLGTITVRSL